VFNILHKLPNTARGLGSLPAWFLRLGAPVFCKPIARLFNKSISTSVVPRPWKCASIRVRPVPKNSAPLEHTDFRPISITPVLCKTLERIVVRRYLYPVIHSQPNGLDFSDQYAFRPTGSTTALTPPLMSSLSARSLCMR